MKLSATCILFITIAVQLSAQKVDTLQYDHMTKLIDNGQQLVAVTKFPGEVDVQFNMRFTPTQPCSLTAVLIAFGVVKFQPFSGNDELVVLVYDAQENTQPWFVNVVKTYKVNLGDKGFPAPNVEESDPLNAPSRDVLTVPLNPPVLISPKRDMIIAVKLNSSQVWSVGGGKWNGFSLLMKYQIPDPDFNRYRRYQIGSDLSGTFNRLATSNGNVGIWIRPIVKYDPNLPPTILTDVQDHYTPSNIELTNYPNPFGTTAFASNSSTDISFTLPVSQHVTLRIYDALGREVETSVNGLQDAGVHTVSFNGDRLLSGVYNAVLQTGNTRVVRKMVLMK